MYVTRPSLHERLLVTGHKWMSLATMNVPGGRSGNNTQFYLTRGDASLSRRRRTIPHATSEKVGPVPARRGGCGRQVEVLDLVFLAGWNQTLRTIATALAAGLPTNAHHPIARIRTGGSAASGGL